MVNRSIIGMCCATVALLWSAMPAGAQPLAERVPEDAVVYFGWCGASQMPSGYAQSRTKALLDDSNIPELFTQFVPALVQKITREQPEAADGLRAFTTIARPMWQHPTAFYFGGVDFDGERPMPKLALICKAGADAQAVHDTVAKLLAGAGADVPVHAFRSGELVGLYVGYADEKAALAGEGGTGNAIGAAAGFKGALAQLQQPEPVLVLYVDVERALAQVDQAVENSNQPQAQEIWPKVRDASGLTGFKRLIFASGFDGNDWGSRGFAEIPAPRSGLLSMMDGKPLGDELFKAVPQSASMVIAGKFDPGRFITELREVVGAVDPEAQVKFDQGLGAAQMYLGKNLRTDILDPLGNQWAMYLAPDVAGNGITGVVIVNKLDDATKAEQGLVALSLAVNNAIAGQVRDEEMSVSFKNTKIGDMRVWYFAVPIVAPAWGIKDGNLYLGLYPQSVAAAARFTSSGKKSFNENEKFAALKQRLGVQSPTAVQFVDLPQLAGPAYQMVLIYLRLGLGLADMWGVEAPEPVLPAFDVLVQHLAPAGSMSWVDDAGWHMKGVSPFPGAGVFAGEAGFVAVGGSAMGAAVLLPALARARESANQVKCGSNMRQIGLGIMMYANDKDGNFPEDYATLVKYMLDAGTSADVFACPAGDAALPKPAHLMQADEVVAWARERSPYVYLAAGKRNDTAADVVILYERLGGHNFTGVNLLFGDGHVEFQPTEQAEQLLQQQGVEVEYRR
jgi:prepilin-type processing-associated H-X9-DG protein